MRCRLPRRSRRLANSSLGAVGNVLIAFIAAAVLSVSSAVALAESDTAPEGLKTMRSLALDLLRIGDYDGAVEFYREIALRAPADARSHYDLAAALSFLRRFEEAAGPIRSAIRLEPDNVQVQEMASLIFLNLRWYEEAFEATLTTARLGESTAMYSLVNMYEKGIGVKADPDQALYWAMQAAEHGHLGAIAVMEQVYRSGRFGRSVDDAKADAWAKRLHQAQSPAK